ncbi:MAG TPA: hypothetical protein GXX46_01660 [Peptococcaceae bacterium]|nr:hypothetical protein [Peptococcaceae bacterium]
MKRRIFWAVLIILITLTGYSNSQSIMQEVNDTLNREKVERSEVFHYELIEEGILVFYNSGEKLSVGIVRNTKGGLKWYPISVTDLHPSGNL